MRGAPRTLRPRHQEPLSASAGHPSTRTRPADYGLPQLEAWRRPGLVGAFGYGFIFSLGTSVAPLLLLFTVLTSQRAAGELLPGRLHLWLGARSPLLDDRRARKFHHTLLCARPLAARDSTRSVEPLLACSVPFREFERHRRGGVVDAKNDCTVSGSDAAGSQW